MTRCPRCEAGKQRKMGGAQMRCPVCGLDYKIGGVAVIETKRTVRQVPLLIHQNGNIHDVYLAGDDPYPHLGTFTRKPTDRQLENLPYIKPMIAERTVGQFWILSGPFEQGPYPDRGAARSDITAGKW